MVSSHRSTVCPPGSRDCCGVVRLTDGTDGCVDRWRWYKAPARAGAAARVQEQFHRQWWRNKKAPPLLPHLIFFYFSAFSILSPKPLWVISKTSTLPFQVTQPGGSAIPSPVDVQGTLSILNGHWSIISSYIYIYIYMCVCTFYPFRDTCWNVVLLQTSDMQRELLTQI